MILELNRHFSGEGFVPHHVLYPTLQQPVCQRSRVTETGWRSPLQVPFFDMEASCSSFLTGDCCLRGSLCSLVLCHNMAFTQMWVHPMPVVWFQIRCCAASPVRNLCLPAPELGNCARVKAAPGTAEVWLAWRVSAWQQRDTFIKCHQITTEIPSLLQQAKAQNSIMGGC